MPSPAPKAEEGKGDGKPAKEPGCAPKAAKAPESEEEMESEESDLGMWYWHLLSDVGFIYDLFQNPNTLVVSIMLHIWVI